ncbi:M48 family metallopeptidase [Nocardioides lianchengensis]|uniref:STE24 endopeptidase n=1 Tax=Nocardioides lianchengensis TaxID=1045774 RepID=A0A1G6MVI2_9ACTN|nr:M48 family metallopeptidase [Nocardioides lianchengensis]NYG10561.1 STE24 endopeptidase [Nocardioides lianchengensis]SDC59560.1 STE24 endopeptidase [Nocardioides lianchengensis]
MTPPARTTALVTTAVGGVAFVVLAVLLVPWDPVPGGPLTPTDPATLFTPEQLDRAAGFASRTDWIGWASLAVRLAAACWLGFSRRGRALFARLPGPWWVAVVLAVAVFEVGLRLLTLPFAVLMRRQLLAYGLSTQSWPAWAVDLAKGEAVDVVGVSLALLVLVACARRWRRAWPAVAGSIAAVLVVLGSFTYPLVVEPLFNNFEPLPDGSLRTGVLALAEREGVDVDEVLVADASRRTTTLNAYVSGIAGSRRVVLYDNLVDDLPQDQALSVVAHELTHAKHDDVVTGTVLGAAGTCFAIGLLGVVLGALRRRGGSPADPAVVPLVLALYAVALVLSSPVQNTISRQIELRADVGALRATEDPAAFVELQRQLALRSVADPERPAWEHFWFGSHPTVLQRTALAERIGEGR